MSQWNVALLAAVLMGVGSIGCGSMEPAEEPSSGATERYLEQLDGEHDQCGKRICFEPIKRDKNITHIFLDFGACPVKDFKVFLTTSSRGTEDVTDRLKTQGGPCKELGADYHFEVQGPDREAKVCIVFKDFVTNDVRIGSKAGDECKYNKNGHDAQSDKFCTKCPKGS